jgi:stringent starvation protein B
MDEPALNKHAVAIEILKTGSLFVHVKAQIEGVIVPSNLKKRDFVVLQVGYNMPVPIPDLEIASEGVSGTLAFKGVPFWCDIPWASVVALIGDNGKGRVYDTAYVTHLAAPLEPPKKTKSGKVIPPYLRVVK